MKKYIKEIIFTILIVVITTNLISFYKSKDIKAKKPLTILKDKTSINGVRIKQLLMQKKLLIINFWGTWCPICNQEIDTINKISQDKEVLLITVAVNSGRDEEIKQFLIRKDVHFLVVNDRYSEISKAFNISTFPTTIFYNIKRDKIIKDSGYMSYLGYLIRKKLVEE